MEGLCTGAGRIRGDWGVDGGACSKKVFYIKHRDVFYYFDLQHTGR